MKIRLLKEWLNGDGTKWPESQVLEMDDENAKKMIGDGLAEEYEPEANDIIKVSPIQADSGLTAEDVTKLVNEVLKKNSQFNHEQENEDLILKTGGFKSMSHFVVEVRSNNGINSTAIMKTWLESVKASGMSEGIDADGGFLVPVEFRNTLMLNVLEKSLILNRCTKIPMATSSVKIPVIEETTHVGSVYGGIIVYRVAEASAITPSKVKLGQIELNLYKLAALAYATTELLEDSPISLEPLLGIRFAEAIAFQMDEDIINGTGVGQAMGVLNAPCLVTVGAEDGQVAKTIDTQNVLNMWARLLSSSQGNSLWLANNDTFPQLASLSMPIGTGGALVGLLQTATNGITGAPIMTLLGKQLQLTEHCQTLGTKGDLILADFGQYLVGQKAGGGVSTATSMHVKFVEDEMAFRFTIRTDGQPWMKSDLTPKHSTNTLSPFLAIESRT